VKSTLHCDQTLNGGIHCSPQQHPLSLSLSLSQPLLFKQLSTVCPLQFFTLVFHALCRQLGLSCSLHPSVLSLYILSSPRSPSHFSPSFFCSFIPQSPTAGDYYTHRRNLSPPISLCLSAVFPLSHSFSLLCIRCPIPSHSFCPISPSLSLCLFLSGCNWYL